MDFLSSFQAIYRFFAAPQARYLRVFLIVSGVLLGSALLLHLHSSRKAKAIKRAIRASFERNILKGELPPSFSVSKRSEVTDHYPSLQYYTLSFPHWEYATSTGRQDRRHTYNALIWGNCRLYLKNYCVSCQSPIDMVSLVNHLRVLGHAIEMHPLEDKKYKALVKAHAARQQVFSIQTIVQRFENRPSDFEIFCADLFRFMGFSAKVTSRTNDGGFDIAMSKDGYSYIVECKCFAPEHPIGRPLLQKLVGANAVQHADYLIFITTSSFSSPAVKYGRQFGIWLIDGARLLELYNSSISPFQAQAPYEPKLDEWMLTREEVRQLMPY